MKKALALTCAMTMAASLFLTGCGGSANTSGSDSNSGDSNGSGKRVVNVCSWGEYIDEDLIYKFEDETGIKVNYQTAESNEALYSLLKTGAGDYDVIVPSDYMIARLIDEGMLAELNYDNIPNYEKIGEQYKSLSFDPENKYTVPYTWGTLGIIYNSTMVDGDIDSWDAMFDEKYAGNVLMIRNSRDALAAALLDLGYDINTTDEAQIQEAYELLADAKSKGVYQSFVMDEVFGKMEGSNAAIAMYYAGDYLTMLDNNPDLKFVVPKEGSNWFVDAMCVLKTAQHKEEAEAWINFIASTESNLANMDYIGYASPNLEALEGYPAYYEETYGEPLDEERYEIMAAPVDVLALLNLVRFHMARLLIFQVKRKESVRKRKISRFYLTDYDTFSMWLRKLRFYFFFFGNHTIPLAHSIESSSAHTKSFSCFFRTPTSSLQSIE